MNAAPRLSRDSCAHDSQAAIIDATQLVEALVAKFAASKEAAERAVMVSLLCRYLEMCVAMALMKYCIISLYVKA